MPPSCGVDVHIIQDAGIVDGLPSVHLTAGQTESLPLQIDPHGLGAGTVLKISKEGEPGILQYEYALTGSYYWDLSAIDGNPFVEDRVHVVPTGNGAGDPTNRCVALTCEPGACADTYSFPEQDATRSCPADTGDVILDLCSVDPVQAVAPASRPAAVETESEEDEAEEEDEDGEVNDRELVDVAPSLRAEVAFKAAPSLRPEAALKAVPPPHRHFRGYSQEKQV